MKIRRVGGKKAVNFSQKKNVYHLNKIYSGYIYIDRAFKNKPTVVSWSIKLRVIRHIKDTNNIVLLTK